MSTTETLRLPHMGEGPEPTATDQVRDALAVSARRMNAEYPEALDVEARALVALYEAIRGSAAQLAGPHWPEHWREALRGERTVTLHDICRLAADPTREAGDGLVAVLSVLAREKGYRLEAAPASAAEPHRVLSSLTAAAGELASGLALDLADGVIDADEAAELQPVIRAEQKALAQVDVLAATVLAKGHTMRRPVAAREAR